MIKSIFNFQFSIFKSKKLIVILSLLTTYYLLLATSSALAHTGDAFWLPGDPIVPCGGTNPNGTLQGDCTQCELLHLVRHLIDFIMVAAAPVLATVFFIIAGVYIMLGGANPGMLSTGKSMFKNTFIGLLIVMMAWLITNTLIQTLTDPPVGPGLSWWEFSCADVGLDQ